MSLLLAWNYYSVAASVGLKSTDIVVDLPAPNAPTTKMCLFEPSIVFIASSQDDWELLLYICNFCEVNNLLYFKLVEKELGL